MMSAQLKSTESKDHLHKEYPKQFPRDQFWHQIKRTINGQPVAERDIQLIVEQISTELDLQPNDHLLDLGCGNGALASFLFDSVSNYVGVDFSNYLIGIAREFFFKPTKVQYIEADIREPASYLNSSNQTNKVLIYGCISYLSKDQVVILLEELRTRLPRLNSIMIGNVADRTKAKRFFSKRTVNTYRLDDPTSAIGVWWSHQEWVDLANQLGFTIKIHHMPAEFYASEYRYDVVLKQGMA